MSLLRLVFIGQGPNQTAWARGLEAGRKFAAGREAWKMGDRTPEAFAEDYCARVAATGAIGTKLGALLDLPLHRFWKTFARRNLNRRWNGKDGKGDKFDKEEGRRTAGQFLVREEFTHHVLLGAAVAECFGFRNPEWLAVKEGYYPIPDPSGSPREAYKHFLLFPHPSGINAWWNEDFNRFRAKKRLAEFVEHAKAHNQRTNETK